MRERIHAIAPSMKRLYQAALELQGIRDESVLPVIFNLSPTLINNWKRRGVSSEGAINAEIILGCSAVWLKYGVGSMKAKPIQGDESYTKDIKIVLDLMLASDQSAREEIRIVVAKIFQKHQLLISESKSETQEIGILPAHRVILNEKWLANEAYIQTYEQSHAHKPHQSKQNS